MKNMPKTARDTGVKLYAQNTSSGRFVCFDCRVCFHKARHCHYTQHHDAGPCNNCGKPLHYAGSAFRAPPKRDVKEWAKLEILIRDGMLFHYCGNSGYPAGTVAQTKRARSARKKKVIYARRNSAGKRMLVHGEGNWADRYALPD